MMNWVTKYSSMVCMSLQFLKIKTQGAPKYLYKLILLKNNTSDARSTHSVSK